MNGKISLLMTAVGLVLAAACVALGWNAGAVARVGGRAIKLPPAQVDMR